MPLFTSPREKYLWLWALAVLAAIYSTLFFGQPLAELFSNQDMQAAIFLFVMILVGVVILVHALKTKPGKFEMSIILGIAAVYIMLFLRLGLPERSHLIEYSVLAIFIHKALNERFVLKDKVIKTALLAFAITYLIGIIDECIQLIIPHRVFDFNDILFNGIAVSMAIGSSLILGWFRKRRKKA